MLPVNNATELHETMDIAGYLDSEPSESVPCTCIILLRGGIVHYVNTLRERLSSFIPIAKVQVMLSPDWQECTGTSTL